MKPITSPTEIEHYRELVRQMTLPTIGKEYEFDPRWVSSQAWNVVPVESAVRLPKEDIPRLVSVLKDLGITYCVAVVTEAGYTQPLAPTNQLFGDLATCYRLSIDEADFREVNRELGPFRFLLTDEHRSWAISCNETYNLFAGRPNTLEALLGEPIQQARNEFLEFVSVLAKGNPDTPLVRVAEHYAAL